MSLGILYNYPYIKNNQLEIDEADASDSDIVTLFKENQYSFENTINNFRINYQKSDFSNQLINCIREQHFEYGVKSKADLLVEEQISINSLATESILNELFVNNFDTPDILIGILQIVSRLSHPSIILKGQIMAVAALSHQNIEVRECGIRCFECWATEGSLRVLRNIKTEPQWLQEYLEGVIVYIEDELCHIL